MARQPALRPGQRIGPYTLQRLLGTGGNAEVWEARPGDGALVAVKVLGTRKTHSEPYQRFTREVARLRQLGEFAGVLPLLDAHVPSSLSKGERAWLAMPVAEPIIDALGDTSSLHQVVAAMAAVADSL